MDPDVVVVTDTTVEVVAVLDHQGPPGDSHVPTAVGVPDGKMLAAASDAWTIVDAPSGGGGVSSWNDLTDKPTEFPPEDHEHTIPDVEGLGEALTDLDAADNALDVRINAALAGPLGRWFSQLINDPANAKVVFLGDSTFYVGGGAGSTGSFYDTIRDWHTLPGMALAGVPEANLIAGGSSGGTLAEWLNDEGSYTPADLIADDPHLIVCMYDLNAVRLGLATLEELNADKEALVAWRDLNLPNADILFVTPPTMTTTVVGTDYVDGITHQAASDMMYQSAMAQIGLHDHVGVADTVSAVWGRTALATSPYKYDELHPTTLGYQMLAHTLADMLSPTGGYAHGPRGLKPFLYYGTCVSAGSGYFDLTTPDGDGRVPRTLDVPLTTDDTVYFSGIGGVSLSGATIVPSGANWRVLLGGDHSDLVGTTWMVETSQVAAPVRTVNGASGDVVLDAGDVGAAASSHTHAVGDVTGLDEQIRDVIGTALVAGSNVTITVNDAGDTITIAATGGAASITSTTLTSINGTGTVTLAAAATITRVTYSGAGRFRLYRTSAGRTADSARAFTTPYTGGAGLLYDYKATGADTDNEQPSDVSYASGETTYYYAADGPVTVTIYWVQTGA